MAWITKHRHETPSGGLDESLFDWSSDDPTGAIVAEHERIASDSPSTAPVRVGPVLDGALGAGREEILDGLTEQLRFDLARGHHLTARELLDSRLAQSGIGLDDALREAIAESLGDVDHERARRERAAGDAEHVAGAGEFDQVIAEAVAEEEGRP